MWRKLLLALALGITAFLWIWLFEYLGAKAFWVTMISFAFFIAAGADLKKLPWMVLGGVLGVFLGMVTFAVSMLVLPTYAKISMAIAGAIFILAGTLVSLPKAFEMLPMFLVGWASFLGAIFRFDYLIMEKAIEANSRVISTLVGVVVSLLFGLFLGALLGTPLLRITREKEVAEKREERAIPDSMGGDLIGQGKA